MADSYFDNLMKSAAQSAVNCFGRVAAKYIDAAGNEIEDICMEVGEITAETVTTDDGESHVRRRTFSVTPVRETNQPLITKINLYGKFEIDGMTWSVETIDTQSPYEIHGTLINVRVARKVPRGHFNAYR